MRRKMILLQRIGFLGMLIALLFSTMSLVNSIDHTNTSIKASGSIVIEDVTVKENVISFNYKTDNITTGQILNIALIRKGVAGNIKTGENKGLELLNRNIVRSFNTQLLTTNGAEKIKLPVSFKSDNYTLVLYVLNKNDQSVSVAAMKDL